MKNKELRNLAKKIAKLELAIQNSPDENEKAQYEQEIMYLTGRITSFEEIDILDEMIQDFLQNA